MIPRSWSWLLALILSSAVACSSNDPAPPPANDGGTQAVVGDPVAAEAEYSKGVAADRSQNYAAAREHYI